MARKYGEYTDDDVISAAAESKSMAQLLSKLGLKSAGGNYINMKRVLQRLGLKCLHWTGQAWNKGQRMKDWSEYTKVCNMKKHLLVERGHRCQVCNLTEWLNSPMPLEVEHKNGDRTDNREDNLLLMCCNCHALTPTWRRAKCMV